MSDKSGKKSKSPPIQRQSTGRSSNISSAPQEQPTSSFVHQGARPREPLRNLTSHRNNQRFRPSPSASQICSTERTYIHHSSAYRRNAMLTVRNLSRMEKDHVSNSRAYAAEDLVQSWVDDVNTRQGINANITRNEISGYAQSPAFLSLLSLRNGAQNFSFNRSPLQRWTSLQQWDSKQPQPRLPALGVYPGQYLNPNFQRMMFQGFANGWSFYDPNKKCPYIPCDYGGRYYISYNQPSCRFCGSMYCICFQRPGYSQQEEPHFSTNYIQPILPLTSPWAQQETVSDEMVRQQQTPRYSQPLNPYAEEFRSELTENIRQSYAASGVCSLEQGGRDKRCETASAAFITPYQPFRVYNPERDAFRESKQKYHSRGAKNREFRREDNEKVRERYATSPIEETDACAKSVQSKHASQTDACAEPVAPNRENKECEADKKKSCLKEKTRYMKQLPQDNASGKAKEDADSSSKNFENEATQEAVASAAVGSSGVEPGEYQERVPGSFSQETRRYSHPLNPYAKEFRSELTETIRENYAKSGASSFKQVGRGKRFEIASATLNPIGDEFRESTQKYHSKNAENIEFRSEDNEKVRERYVTSRREETGACAKPLKSKLASQADACAEPVALNPQDECQTDKITSYLKEKKRRYVKKLPQDNASGKAKDADSRFKPLQNEATQVAVTYSAVGSSSVEPGEYQEQVPDRFLEGDEKILETEYETDSDLLKSGSDFMPDVCISDTSGSLVPESDIDLQKMEEQKGRAIVKKS